MIDTDQEFKEKLITSVSHLNADTGTCAITTDDNWSFIVPRGPFTPQPGQTARFYGRGVGYTVRGLVIDGHVFFYESVAEHHARQVREQQARLEAERVAYDQNAEPREARIQALPEPFRRRVRGFVRRAPATAWRHQDHEIVICQAAAAIHAACPTLDAVQAFVTLQIPEMLERVPLLNDLGLSGNGFDAAVRLARYATGEGTNSPVLIERDHHALCPLFGCQQVGCAALEAGTWDAAVAAQPASGADT